MEAEIVHVERIEATELVRAVEELHRGALISELLATRGLDAWQIDPFRLSRAIVDAVNYFKARDPERVERLWQRIQGYRALLAEYRVKDEAVQARLRRPLRRERVRRSWEAVVGFPFFVYGAVVNGLPYLIPRWMARRLAKKETDYATVRFLASVVAFPLFWALETWVVGRLTGAAGAAVFALSLPLTGLVAYRYLVGAGRLRSRLRFVVLAFTREQAARCLVAEREAIIAELERVQADYLAPKGSSRSSIRLNLRGRQEGREIIPADDLLLDQQLGQRREDLALRRQGLADSLVGRLEKLSDLVVDATGSLLAVLSLSHRRDVEEERLAGRLERRQPQRFTSSHSGRPCGAPCRWPAGDRPARRSRCRRRRAPPPRDRRATRRVDPGARRAS